MADVPSTPKSDDGFQTRLQDEIAKARGQGAPPTETEDSGRQREAQASAAEREGAIPGVARERPRDLPAATGGKWHVVRPGEDLQKIAERHGCLNWDRIWNDPNNAELKAERDDDANVLFPGDLLFVPDPRPKSEPGETEQRHRFRVHPRKERLRLVLKDADDEPLGGMEYVLALGKTVYRGTTKEDGSLEHEIPPRVSDGRIEYDGETLELEIGKLDPVRYLTGVQARLNNLGYDAGPVDGKYGPVTKRAVQEFQRDRGLNPDGIPGPITQKELEAVYRAMAQAATPAADEEPRTHSKSALRRRWGEADPDAAPGESTPEADVVIDETGPDLSEEAPA